MTTTNNFFVYADDSWKQINSDFTTEIDYLQQLILILNNKLDKLTDNVESLNNYEDIKNNIRNLLQNKLKFYLYNYTLPSDIYQLAKICSIINYKDENYNHCSYYIDNVNGSDENDGLSIFTPRKTLPQTLDSSLTYYGAIVVRLMDSPIPYNLSQLERNMESIDAALIYRGNYQDPSKVKIENNTYAEFKLNSSNQFLGFFHLTIDNSLYIQKEGKIAFYNCNINSDIYLEPVSAENTVYLEKGRNFQEYLNSEEFTSTIAYFHSTNDTITFNDDVNSNLVYTYPTGYFLSPNDFKPLPANTNITNLEELTIFLNYLQNALGSENVNINNLIGSILTITPSINSSRQLTINDYLNTQQASIHSIFNAPIQIYNNDTNELVGEISSKWYNNYNIFNNINISSPVNFKILIGNLFEILYAYIISTTVSSANLRTALNNNKISGTNILGSTFTYQSTYSNGGEYYYNISNGTSYTISIDRMRFSVTNTDTAEFRFGYDYEDSNPQHYIQMLMCENSVIFNEVVGNTSSKLKEFTLPEDLSNSTNVPFSFTHRNNGELTIQFNDEEYITQLNTPLTSSIWYINIPTNTTSLRCVAYNGIKITEYPPI